MARINARLIYLLILATCLLVPSRSQGGEDWLKRGISHLELRRYDEAINSFSEAIRLNPDDPVAYCNRGVAWFFKSEYDRAIGDFNKALEINPRYAQAYCNRGILWTEKADYDQAISDCTKALEINPHYAEAYYSRAVAWFFKGDHDRAIADFTKVLEIDSQNATAYCNRGLIWTRKADYDRAIADYTKALEVNPAHTEAHAQLAWVLATCPDGRYRNGARAVKLAKKVVLLAPEGHFMAHLAAAYAELGRFEDAITIQKGVIASLNKKGKTEDLAEYERQLKAYEAHKPWRTSVSRGEDLERKVESSTQREPAIRRKIHKETFPAEESSASTVSKRLETLRGSTERVFFVQVGAFVSRENAEKERARLKKIGYTPHVLAVSDSEGKVWHQVLMGEYTTRQQAKEAAANFSAKENMPSCVFVFKAP